MQTQSKTNLSLSCLSKLNQTLQETEVALQSIHAIQCAFQLVDYSIYVSSNSPLLYTDVYLLYFIYLFSQISNIQSRSKSLQPSVAPQPPENDDKMPAASHQRLKPPGGTEAAKSRQRRLAFSCRCKLFERDCTLL